MKYVVVKNGVRLSKKVEDIVIAKLSRLEKMLYKSDELECRVVVKSHGSKEKVEITIPTKFLVLRSEVEADDVLDAIDIAKDMSFSKASVSVALKKLKEQELINVEPHTSVITLTDKGYEIANKIYERHKLISKWLLDLGVSEETAARDACLIEHDLSDETFAILKKKYFKNRF